MSENNKKLTEALNLAKEQICENPENAIFVKNFIEVFIKGLKDAGQDKGKTSGDFMINGAIVGYALRYLNEQTENKSEGGNNG